MRVELQLWHFILLLHFPSKLWLLFSARADKHSVDTDSQATS